MDNDSPSPLDSTERIIQADKEAAVQLVETNKEAAIELVEIQIDAGLRNRALTFSVIIGTLVVCAQIAFCYIGKTLIIPDIVWVIILAPWIGMGGSKLVTIISDIVARRR